MTSKRGPTLGRRAFVAGAAGALGAGVIRGAMGADAAEAQVAPGPSVGGGGEGASEFVDTTKVQGPIASPVGERSPFETPARTVAPTGTSSRTPHQDLLGTLTPSDLHFERHHAGVPRIDPSQYSLLIHGMVERPMVFTLDDLKRFPSVSWIRFLECSGNFPRNAPEESSPQQICGLTSQSEWTGVPLSLLFREVGVLPGATWFVAEGQDAAVMTRSVPVEKAWDDALIAYGQNGEALRPETGYPARLFLPGWEGNANVKWIRRIELSDGPFMTRDETSRYTDPLKGGRARQFSLVMDARSIITHPCHPERITPGWREIRGIAWSGRGRISSVELSFDEGARWQKAELQEPILPKAHVRFRSAWRWNGEETTILSRATDETGYVQPTQREIIEARGVGTNYHLNPITGWRIRPDGQVVYRTEVWE